MPRWKPLPLTLEPEVALLVERLRELKDGSGLSLVSLSNRTAYSKSSWERYLNGKKFPPQQAVQALSRIAGEDAARLDAVWGAAERAWNRRGAGAAEPVDDEPSPVPEAAESEVAASAYEAAEAAEDEIGASGEILRSDAPQRARIGRRAWLPIAAAVLGISLGVVWLTVGGFPSGAHTTTVATPSGSQLLLSPACSPVVAMGEHDTCVHEVQLLLSAAGGRLSVDSDFGPETLRNLTAFQVLAGLPATGVVNAATATALYAQKVSMVTWSPKRVEQRIRQVFPAAVADEAVVIARCQSMLDPHYVLPNSDGSRNWGVFEISDGRVDQFGGTPLMALDPEWNIQAAYKLWQMHKGFSDWPFCEGAYPTASTSQSSGPSSSAS